MKLTKIHRVLKFNQSDWKKKYIDFHTEKRMNALDGFKKRFFLINDQFRLWKNNGKFKKKNQCEISKK